MPKYTVKAYHKSTSYEKVWLGVEADSLEEALALAKESPDEQDWQDSKGLDVTDSSWEDQDTWEVLND